MNLAKGFPNSTFVRLSWFLDTVGDDDIGFLSRQEEFIASDLQGLSLGGNTCGVKTTVEKPA